MTLTELGQLAELGDWRKSTRAVSSAMAFLRSGGIVLVADSKDRENETDLVVAAEFITTEQAAFIVRHSTGIVCAPMSANRCEALGLPVEQEERQVPMLLHAKLSVVVAREWQGVYAPEVLQAIRFHTTMHAQATALDQVVFLADKLEWDQQGTPPYAQGLSAALEDGLDGGTRWMLQWMALPEAHLLIPHPDLRDAWRKYGVMGNDNQL